MIITAILQARCSSTRLPNKVLKKIKHREMILCQIDRIKKSRYIDYIIVATSTDPSDDTLANVIENEEGVGVSRGSLDNVLQRFWNAAKSTNSDIIIRLTGDCPVTDWEVIDEVISYHIGGKFDYSSNTIDPSFPDGLDVEVMNIDTLEETYNNANTKFDQEHVTPYIYKNTEKFKLGSFKNDEDLSGFRWTVDEPEDFKLISKIYNHFSLNDFKLKDILDLLESSPDLISINSQFTRNEGSKGD